MPHDAVNIFSMRQYHQFAYLLLDIQRLCVCVQDIVCGVYHECDEIEHNNIIAYSISMILVQDMMCEMVRYT